MGCLINAPMILLAIPFLFIIFAALALATTVARAGVEFPRIVVDSGADGLPVFTVDAGPRPAKEKLTSAMPQRSAHRPNSLSAPGAPPAPAPGATRPRRLCREEPVDG